MVPTGIVDFTYPYHRGRLPNIVGVTMNRSPFALIALGLVACWSSAVVSTDVEPQTQEVPGRDVVARPDMNIRAQGRVGIQDERLAVLVQSHWDHMLQTSPVWAGKMGDHRFDDRLPDPDGREANEKALRSFLSQADAFDAASLNGSDQLTLSLFKTMLQHDVDAMACGFHLWSVSPRYNVYNQYADMHEALTIDSPAAAQAHLSRMRQLPAHFDGVVGDLREGLVKNLVANAASVQKTVHQLDGELMKPSASWPHMAAVDSASMSEEDLATFKADMLKVIEEELRPAVVRYRDALRDEILPRARGAGAEGLSALANGTQCYEALVRQYTTLPTASAEERHTAGLRALESIHQEFREIGGRALKLDTIPAIFEHLRESPELRFSTEEEVENAAILALKAAEKAMPNYFGRLPIAPCDVTRIPAHEAPFTTIAYYQPPQSERGGRYFINTHAPNTRPKHEAAVLAYHESIPGHHLQIAIAQELDDVPGFRRYLGMTAFVEGWALYTERLSDEMGLYKDDIDRLGMLSFDAWRASRLVVDTGIHAKGWSRADAERFLRDNTPLALNNIENEVDRYITTPGQALAYKTGQQEIWRLRREAEAALGDRFDIKAFHDTVLGAGAITLPLLEQRVDAWVKSVGPAAD